jgi:hypothetical protein
MDRNFAYRSSRGICLGRRPDKRSNFLTVRHRSGRTNITYEVDQTNRHSIKLISKG